MLIFINLLLSVLVLVRKICIIFSLNKQVPSNENARLCLIEKVTQSPKNNSDLSREAFIIMKFFCIFFSLWSFNWFWTIFLNFDIISIALLNECLNDRMWQKVGIIYLLKKWHMCNTIVKAITVPWNLMWPLSWVRSIIRH